MHDQQLGGGISRRHVYFRGASACRCSHVCSGRIFRPHRRNSFFSSESLKGRVSTEPVLTHGQIEAIEKQLESFHLNPGEVFDSNTFTSPNAGKFEEAYAKRKTLVKYLLHRESLEKLVDLWDKHPSQTDRLPFRAPSQQAFIRALVEEGKKHSLGPNEIQAIFGNHPLSFIPHDWKVDSEKPIDELPAVEQKRILFSLILLPQMRAKVTYPDDLKFVQALEDYHKVQFSRPDQLPSIARLKKTWQNSILNGEK